MPDPYQASATDLAAIREICEAYGFCLVKDLLDPAQLETLQAGMKAESEAHAGRPLPDLLGLPRLRHIYFEPRLLAIARALLGAKLTYDGEATFNFETQIGSFTLNPFSLLHCDAIGMPGDLRVTWKSPTDATYRAYRFGIYLQDYTRASGSLKVIVGSHRGDPQTYIGGNLFRNALTKRAIGARKFKYAESHHPLYNLPTQPGDVVIWNLRTFHSAGAKCFVDDPSFAIHPDLEARFADEPGLFAPPPGPRNAMFFDYAAPAEDIDLYLKYRARPSPASIPGHLARRSDGPEAIALAESHGIELRFDPVIMALSAEIATLERQRPVSDRVPGLRKRLYRLLSQHREYSPYFPLFDRERFARSPNPNAAVDSALADITTTLKVEGVLGARAGT